MTEQLLREALHGAMAVGSPPAPMSSALIVRVARRARRRRRTGWSGASCAGVVAAVAATTLVLQGAPARPSGGTAAAFDAAPRPAGVQLLDALVSVVPVGYAVGYTQHDAAVNGYQAVVQLTRDGGTGALVAEVHSAGNLETAASEDDYTFDLPSAGGLYVRAHDCAHPGLAWELRDSTGMKVGSSYGCHDGEAHNLAAGSYRLIAYNMTGATVGGYALDVNTIPQDVSQSMTVDGPSVNMSTAAAHLSG